MADISKITLPDNSQYNIKDSIARNNVLWYGTCNTLANTIEKAITISGITSLAEGLSIRVKMLNEAAAASPTLNLNSLGAKAITRSAKPSLPSGYSRVLGFSMNDNTYFEIDNFKLTGADTVRFSFSMTANCNVFGCYTNSSATNNYSLFVSTSSTASYLRYNGGTYNSYIPAANRDQQFDVVITPHGITGMPTNSSWTAKTFTASSDMCIGTSSLDASSASLIGNLYGAFIVEGRFNGIPCERLSDNVLGYYDTYSKTFYEPAVGTPTSLGYDQNDYFDNAGTGEWAAGEVLDLVYDGTSWIIVDGAIADEETYGYTKLSDSISSTSTNVAATANAVKTAYDLANGKQDALVSGTNIKTINNESVLGSGNITIQGGGDSLPDQTGHSGDILTTNGTAASWMDVSEASSVSIDTSISSSSTDNTIPSSKAVWDALSNVDALPDQTGHSGKYLTTNGTVASWRAVSIPSPADATPLVDGTAAVGTSTDYAREDHVHPTDTSRAPTSHASSAITYGIGTSSNYGHVKLSDSTSSTSGTSDGIAATPSAVRTAYNLANQKVSQTASAGGGDAHSLIDNTYSYIRLGVHVEQDDEHNTLELTSTTTTIHNVVTPTANGDAANKQYVDNAVAGSGLPDQTGNSGKYLTTNGTAASWGATSATSTKSIDSSPTSASSNLVTSGGVYTAINNKVNRTTAVNAADTNYTTLMARGVKLMDATSYDAVSDWSSELVNGAIAWRYE